MISEVSHFSASAKKVYELSKQVLIKFTMMLRSILGNADFDFLKPTISMCPQFFRRELCTFRMSFAVVTDFGMTVETKRNAVFESVLAAFFRLNDMVTL